MYHPHLWFRMNCRDSTCSPFYILVEQQYQRWFQLIYFESSCGLTCQFINRVIAQKCTTLILLSQASLLILEPQIWHQNICAGIVDRYMAIAIYTEFATIYWKNIYERCCWCLAQINYAIQFML